MFFPASGFPWFILLRHTDKEVSNERSTHGSETTLPS